MQTWPPEREQATTCAAVNSVVRPMAPQRRVEQRRRLRVGAVEARAHGGVQVQRGRIVGLRADVDAERTRAEHDIGVAVEVIDVVVRPAATGRGQGGAHGGARQSHAGW